MTLESEVAHLPLPLATREESDSPLKPSASLSETSELSLPTGGSEFKAGAVEDEEATAEDAGGATEAEFEEGPLEARPCV